MHYTSLATCSISLCWWLQERPGRGNGKRRSWWRSMQRYTRRMRRIRTIFQLLRSLLKQVCINVFCCLVHIILNFATVCEFIREVFAFWSLFRWELHSLVQLKHCVDELSKSTYPSLAAITVFIISGLQSVIYWKNFCHVWWVSYGLYVISAFVHLCVLFSGILVHLVATLTGYVDILLNLTVFLESIVR